MSAKFMMKLTSVPQNLRCMFA